MIAVSKSFHRKLVLVFLHKIITETFYLLTEEVQCNDTFCNDCKY